MKKVLAVFLMVMLLTGTALAAATPATGATTAATTPAATICPHTNTTMTVVQAATCTEPGYAKIVCSDCGETWYSVIPATGHDYQSVVTAPTCTEGGYTTHTCSVCGDSYVDSETAPTGHDYVDVVTAPTCTEQGYTTHTCSRCGDSYVDTYTDPTGHNYVYQYDADVVYDEAGNITGYNSYGTWKCENCGDVVEASEGNAIYYVGPVTAASSDAAAASAAASDLPGDDPPTPGTGP